MNTQMPADRTAALQETGWTRRFTALGRRLEEAVELYRQLGFEVLLEPADPDEQVSAGAESCRQCFVTTYARTIYTRPCTTARPDEPASAPVLDMPSPSTNRAHHPQMASYTHET